MKVGRLPRDFLRDLQDLTAQSTQDSRTACCAAQVAQGYTIVANVGNPTTDIDGGKSDQEYLLPNVTL